LTDWRRAFIAMGIAIGEPLDSLLAVLGEGAAGVAPLAAAVRSETRENRARALAEALTPIALDIEAMELSWPG